VAGGFLGREGRAAGGAPAAASQWRRRRGVGSGVGSVGSVIDNTLMMLYAAGSITSTKSVFFSFLNY